ncbi:hypothetical protein [Desulfogranum marinum]|uniref:hypothetical protein n=1 Tax=Desulfogranum marinum TaxID=453220 RepID=UPI0029C61585|nr:hypothetical protein [Desulfogranum marinum]
MRSLINTAITILSLMFSSSALAEVKEFPWATFLPAINGKHECSLDHLGLCKGIGSCEVIGGYWWRQECHQNMSASQALMAKLAGDIHFTYNMFGLNWNEYYHFDINTLTEIDQSGYFQIYGTDVYSNRVRTYGHGANLFGAEMYVFTNYGFSTLDERFVFEWSNSSRLTGTIEVKTKDQNWDESTSSSLTGYYTP